MQLVVLWKLEPSRRGAAAWFQMTVSYKQLLLLCWSWMGSELRPTDALVTFVCGMTEF